MDSTDLSTSGGGGGGPQLPPGFRFHPTDEELVVHYLKKKTQSAPFPASIIADIDLYKFDPWELPAKAVFGEQEWYFFSPRERKYPNGARPNRAATSGYWKATGTDKPVLTSGGAQKVGVKKALVFYGGKPPRGVKTDWIMHEYRLADNKPPTYEPPNKRASLRLDDWVLCRIYKKSPHRAAIDHDEREGWIRDDDAHNLFDEMLSVPSGLSLKRSLPCLYWNDAMPSKRASVSTIDDEIMTSVVNAMADQMNSPSSMDGLISPMQLVGGGGQSGAMPGTLLGEESEFRQPYQVSGLNWYC